jgi:hypothetical protein
VTTPEQPVLAVFSDLSPDARTVVAETLERTRGVPFLSSLGSALTYSPQVAEIVVRLALRRVKWDGSAALVGRLSDNEPWSTVRTVLAEALEVTRNAIT